MSTKRKVVLFPVALTTLLVFLLCDLPTAASSSKQQAPQRPELVTKCLEKNRDIYYFGIGSNMLRSKLENRSICGNKIKIVSMEPAYVENYRLAFNMRGFPPLEPGMSD